MATCLGQRACALVAQRRGKDHLTDERGTRSLSARGVPFPTRRAASGIRGPWLPSSRGILYPPVCQTTMTRLPATSNSVLSTGRPFLF